ncbi:MAG: sigma-70 family RNA polymerase sigma factor [Ardenticatenaceae bacterium]|nr:sigma-70 family RNA polymerase sigma factor [Ardenticatenaceae bacterium]
MNQSRTPFGQPAKDEQTLIQEAKAGNAESFGDLYETHLAAIYQYISFRVGSVHDTEDLTETVFIKAWQRINQYEQQRVPFIAWLYRIAHNSVIDHYRTLKPTQNLDVVENKGDGRLTVEQETLQRDEIRQMMEAIPKLSDLHQHVIILRFLKGLSHAEVAEILDRRVESVRVLQHRALKELQSFMALGEAK